MKAAERWRGRLDRANAEHVAQLTFALRREFARLLSEVNPKAPFDAVRAHAQRLNVILATQKRATVATFGFLALEMLSGKRGKILTGNVVDFRSKSERNDNVVTPSRADQIAAVLLELAKTAASGAVAVAMAELLSRDPVTVAAVESAILTAVDHSPSVIAAGLLAAPRIRAQLARTQAIATGVDVVIANLANAATEDSGAIGSGRNDLPNGPPMDQNPPSPPAPPPEGGGPVDIPPPRRSRFSEMVERIVREEAPVRARSIATTSGRVIADVLGQGAREGWSEERTRKELEARLGREVALHRARRISRTELGSAQNAATLAIAEDRAASGVALEKVWVAIDDERTRPTHRDADDQRRPLNDPFAVGTSALMHPGDPHGPPGEIINCRCAMVIQPV